MNNKPTIAAAIILFLSLVLSFYITVYDQELKKNKSDVEIFITKEPVALPLQLIENNKKSIFIKSRNFVVNNIKNQRRFMHSLIDSYEYEFCQRSERESA